MDISIKLLIIMIAVLLTGLSAGLCFTWTNAVTPGIGRLDNVSYLQAFQAMNRAIINPTFMVVFFGAFIAQLVSVILWKNASSTIILLLIAATLLYFFGLVIVTIFGNVPLNELLDQTNIANASAEELQQLRNQFEVRWNRFHFIRTITSTLSFGSLLIALIHIAKYQTNS
ncbi:putative membrane protein [Kordia periserrulae]|uniref:Putative membrane protein n=1 Tax=Kordia periserrulae TaxID=701523 RepID=A0A2T6C1C2_9FLAO|nr:anthrone oxygenase family protein [Kordia periserrulae]PTX62111.1 putative membrane protein [Kordia periserrulae]